MNQDEALEILKMGHNVFLTGQAGAGKTYVINSYIKYLRKHKIKVAVTASTGIAATHISGTTIHSWSGLGIKDFLDDYDIDNLSQKERLAKNFLGTEVLIIDEISMLSGVQLASIDKLARYIRQNSEAFGGMQVILVGDFFQLPPVTKGRAVPVFCFESDVWKKMRLAICYLNTQYRQDDARLERVLFDIRTGQVDEDTIETLSERMVEAEENSDVTKLYTHNVDVDKYNEKQLSEIKSPAKIYTMEAVGNKNIVDSLKNSCLAPESLVLKKGARVMFLKNNYERGYVNGSIGHVYSDKSKYPVVELLDGKKIEATPEDWQVEDNGKVKAKITQIPLRLAWAITVHKSQGMSLDEAVMDLADCFVPGQGYVALSRVRTLGGITLKGIGPMALRMDERVMNFDVWLRETSEKTALRLESFEKCEIEDKQKKFIIRANGNLTEVADGEIENNNQTTYEKTLNLILQKKSFEDMAEIRGVTLETIIGHIEYLKKNNIEMNIEYLRPDNLNITKINKVFKKHKTTSLSKVKNEISEEYSYLDIRVARLFLK